MNEYHYRNCRGCIYFRKNFPQAKTSGCQYFGDTGIARGCEPDRCDKKKAHTIAEIREEKL